jgi:hypothetical protein
MNLAAVLLLAFLVFLGVLGALSTAVAKSASATSSKAGGCLGGCGLGLAFLFLCGLGFVGLSGFLVALAVETAVEANPIRKIEIGRGEPALSSVEAPERTAELRDPSAPVHLLFTVEGELGSELADLVGRIGGVDPAEVERFLTIHRRDGADGSDLSVYDFCLPLTERDLARLEETIRRELDGLAGRLPERVTIHFEGAERLY